MTVQHNLPDGKVKLLGEFKLQRNCNQSYSSNIFFWLLKITFGNDFWASKCLLQLAQMASCDFLCTLFTACISHPSPDSSNGPDKREYYFVNCLFAVLCIVWFQKITRPPPRRELEIPGGWGGQRPRKFQRGGGLDDKITFRG